MERYLRLSNAREIQIKEEETMKCVICKNGETKPGHTTVTFDKEDSILVLKRVPAEICGTCGEDYLDQEVTGRVLNFSKQAQEEGVELKIMKYPQEPALAAAD